MDDFVLFGDDADVLNRHLQALHSFLGGLRLRLHDRKSRVYTCAAGLTFLGWRILPGQMRLARANVVRIRRRLKKIAQLYHAGRLSFDEVECRVQAWLGHAGFGDTWHLRSQLFNAFTLVAAEHGRNARGFLEQQSTERSRLEP